MQESSNFGSALASFGYGFRTGYPSDPHGQEALQGLLAQANICGRKTWNLVDARYTSRYTIGKPMMYFQ